MVGVGFSEMLIAFALIFGSGIGLPMGMPPGPEDPMMFRVAPENCIFYATWTGVGEIDGAANPTEAWMSQPEIQKMVLKLRTAYRGAILNQAKRNDDPVAVSLAAVFLEVAELAGANPVAFYVSDYRLDNDRPDFKGGAIIGMGNAEDRIETAFAKFAAEVDRTGFDETGIEKIEIDGQPAYSFRLPQSELEIQIGLRDNYFVVGFGAESLTQLAAKSKTDPPKWLSKIRTELSVQRFSSLCFIDSKRALESITDERFGDSAPFGELVNEIINDDVKSVSWVSGLDDQGFIGRCSIATTPKLTGILSAIDREPIPQADLRFIPADSAICLATRLSTQEILRVVTECMQRIGQESALEESFSEFQKISGMSLKDEFIAALGDYFFAYYQLDRNNPASGWVASIRIEDDMSFQGIFERINRGIESAIKEQGAPLELTKQKIDQQDFYSIGDNSWTKVTWGLVDDQWYFGHSLEEISRLLTGHTESNQLANHETIKGFYEFGDREGLKGPVAVVGLNLKPILTALWPFLDAFVDQPGPINPDFDFSFSDIPPLETLVKNLQPNFSAIYRTESGFQILQRQTYPGASPGVTIVAASALSLPFILSEYENPQSATNRNNLKQIGLAFHIFQDSRLKFPAAYTTDDNGQPLLSWRVHLLPHLDQQELYEQFHLDEAWDSAHNISLLEKMPDVFRHPTAHSPVGMTSYLAVTGDDAVFTAPKDSGGDRPEGKISFANVVDGTSNTVMMVEVNSEYAVPWTKPSDLTNDPKLVLEKTKGLRTDGRFLIVLTDGSIQTVGKIAETDLQAILKINDGKWVEIPRGPRP